MEDKALESYTIDWSSIPVRIHIYSRAGQPVPFYHISLVNLTEETNMIINRLREEIITKLSFRLADNKDNREKSASDIKNRFTVRLKEEILLQFSLLDEKQIEMITNYIIITSIGLAEMEFLLQDPELEEIVVNGSKDPVWVYHKSHGWLKTNILYNEENKIRHFATQIARKVDLSISILEPLLDAHLLSGDRVNATLMPITTAGNTITIRKFSSTPWTIVSFLQLNTLDYTTAAMIWQAIQFELSILIVGGTGSGKTSFLNGLSNFFPPNQRIISIEDTRELQLSKSLHWVPMQSRRPNPEGKGGISMLDCMINTLRMRPDRILVGEVRRAEELEVMFEAMHTGHSVYSTFHASSVSEAVSRLVNPPINLPKNQLGTIGLMVVQHRNRRTGKRRTFQIAEINEEGRPNIIMQHNAEKDVMDGLNFPSKTLNTLSLFTGMSQEKISDDLKEKINVLDWMVRKDITNIEKVGLVMSDYYVDKDVLLDKVKNDADF